MRNFCATQAQQTASFFFSFKTNENSFSIIKIIFNGKIPNLKKKKTMKLRMHTKYGKQLKKKKLFTYKIFTSFYFL